jgi:hypothetical protein
MAKSLLAVPGPFLSIGFPGRTADKPYKNRFVTCFPTILIYFLTNLFAKTVEERG